MNTKSTVLLKHHLKQLKLPTMLAECGKIAARAAGSLLPPVSSDGVSLTDVDVLSGDGEVSPRLRC